MSWGHNEGHNTVRISRTEVWLTTGTLCKRIIKEWEESVSANRWKDCDPRKPCPGTDWLRTRTQDTQRVSRTWMMFQEDSRLNRTEQRCSLTLDKHWWLPRQLSSGHREWKATKREWSRNPLLFSLLPLRVRAGPEQLVTFPSSGNFILRMLLSALKRHP